MDSKAFIINCQLNFQATGDVKGFFAEHRFLSNFHLVNVKLDGVTYPSTENAFQAAKTLDPIERQEFTFLTPSNAKKRGKQVQLRSDWEQVKDSIMEDLNRQKYSQGELKDQLLATGNGYLEETNWWKDKYWGVCDGVGENRLGKIIMKIREELRSK